MPKVRQGSAERWSRRTSAATPDYQSGVQNPRVPWKAATVQAADAHSAAVTKAVAEKRFLKGVNASSDEKWSSGASGKGAERFAGGVTAAVPEYQAGVAPYLAVIESTQLPPRGPKGDPRNIQRVAVLAAALNKKKMSGFAGLRLLVAVSVVFVLLLASSLLVRAYQERACGADVSPKATSGTPSEAHRRLAWVCFMLASAAPFLVMGAAIDTVTATVTAPGVGPTAMVAVAGDSLQVRNAPNDAPPLLLQCWPKGQAAGFVQLTHPSGHDQVRDLRLVHGNNEVLPALCPPYTELLQPQELVTLFDSGSAVAGDVELFTMLIYYPNLPGINAQLIDNAGLAERFEELVTIQDTTTATVAATYSGPRALNAASDLLIANTDYAILGAAMSTFCGALTIRGSDLGNLRVSIPGMNNRQDITTQWFPWLSGRYNLPLIPVINSANKAAIFIENVTDENLAAVPFSLLLARLKM